MSDLQRAHEAATRWDSWPFFAVLLRALTVVITCLTAAVLFMGDVARRVRGWRKESGLLEERR